MRNFGGQRQKLFWEKYLKSFSLIIEDVLKRGNPKQEEMNHWLRGMDVPARRFTKQISCLRLEKRPSTLKFYTSLLKDEYFAIN